MTQLFTRHLNEAILNGIYGTYLHQLLEDNWATTQEGDLYRQAIVVDDNHNLAVMLDFVAFKAMTAFAFIKGSEGDKDVKALYKARLALTDTIEALVGTDMDVDLMNEIVSEMRHQVRRDVVGGLRKDGAYTIEEADVLMNDLWYFMSDGNFGTVNNDLVYGRDQLIQGGEFTKPKTLVSTGFAANEESVTDLNALFEAS